MEELNASKIKNDRQVSDEISMEIAKLGFQHTSDQTPVKQVAEGVALGILAAERVKSRL